MFCSQGALARLCEGNNSQNGNRAELEDGSIWDSTFAPIYNSDDEFTHVDEYDEEISHLNPNEMGASRTGTYLKGPCYPFFDGASLTTQRCLIIRQVERTQDALRHPAQQVEHLWQR